MSDSKPRKRRFDQGAPASVAEEPVRKVSRVDGTAREVSSSSPAPAASDKATNSPSSSTPPVDKAAAAAAALAKINAAMAERKKAGLNLTQPIRTPSAPAAPPPPSEARSNAPVAGARKDDEVVEQDGDFIKEIDINEMRNRYTLTKGATQKQIMEETGADITTRGEFFPDLSMATGTKRPLYLHITSKTREGLDAAVAKLEALMSQDLPNLVDERRFRRREPEPFERDELGRRKWPEAKIPIDLEPVHGFNLRAQVVGAGGRNVKYIAQMSTCKVQIKGQGSGFVENSTGQESDEPMYLHIASPDVEKVKQAQTMAEELLVNVREEYQRFKSRAGQPPPPPPPPPPPATSTPSTDPYGYGSTAGYSAPPSSTANQQPNYYSSGDAYAAYGGYENYMRYMQQAQAWSANGQAYGGAAAPSAPAQPPTPTSAYGYAQASTPTGAYGSPYSAAPAGYGTPQAAYSPPPPPPSAGATAPPPPPPPGSTYPYTTQSPYAGNGNGARAPPPPPSTSGSYAKVPPPPGL